MEDIGARENHPMLICINDGRHQQRKPKNHELLIHNRARCQLVPQLNQFSSKVRARKKEWKVGGDRRKKNSFGQPIDRLDNLQVVMNEANGHMGIILNNKRIIVTSTKFLKSPPKGKMLELTDSGNKNMSDILQLDVSTENKIYSQSHGTCKSMKVPFQSASTRGTPMDEDSKPFEDLRSLLFSFQFRCRS